MKVVKRKKMMAMLLCMIYTMIMLCSNVWASEGYKDELVIGVVNFEAVWGDKDANLKQMKGYIEEAAEAGVELLIFPEMALTGYIAEREVPLEEQMQKVEAELVPGPSTDYIGELAMKYDMYIVYGLTEKDPDDETIVYNSAAVVGPEGYIDCYRKIQPVEGEWCTAGEEPVMFDTPWGPMGLSICYDTYAVPELARYYIAQGSRMIINPTATSRGFNSTTGDNTKWAWYYMNRIESLVDRDSVFVASANLAATDGPNKEKIFPGGSVVVGPGGDNRSYTTSYVGSEFATQPGLFYGEIDLSKATGSYFNSSNYRPDLYMTWYEEMAAQRAD